MPSGLDPPHIMRVLEMPNFFFPAKKVMVRGDYTEALKALKSYSSEGTKGIVIVGHPGIGRTMDSIKQA
jgi:hypothetical protein